MRCAIGCLESRNVSCHSIERLSLTKAYYWLKVVNNFFQDASYS